MATQTIATAIAAATKTAKTERKTASETKTTTKPAKNASLYSDRFILQIVFFFYHFSTQTKFDCSVFKKD